MSLKLFICASVLLVCCIRVSIAGTNETDKQALLHFKSLITKDPLGVLSSWNDSLPVCNWYGVQCGLKHARVTLLDLDSSKLSGTISPSIGNLSFLSVLNLKKNSFGGTIPPEIGGLYRLQYMSLSYNYLVGELPSNISRCSQLIELHVYQNTLVGQIPPELGSLPYLETLFLSINYFTGTIPASLGNLSSLSTLGIQQNNLGGSIPTSLGKLINLTNLYLDQNNLIGQVPPSIFNLSYLRQLTLGSNHLEGNLPSDLGNMLPNLQYFDISHNNFSGSIPSSISNSSNLVTLIMPQNKFQGQVPSLRGLNNLQNLELFDNKLGVGDPANDLEFIYSLANAANLVRVVAGNNNFSGTFTTAFCNFSMLFVLTIGENNLTGEIPSCIGNLANLASLDVRENNLVGSIPQSIGSLSYLDSLYLGDNQLSGSIPSALGQCGNLLALDLSSNNFSGGIPTEIFHLSSLFTTLDVSNNRLTGPLSIEVWGLVNLGRLYVSDNLLSGEIPTTLGYCVDLEELHMEGNFFRGVIPSTLASLKSLQILDLSRNNLSGNIPNSMQGLPLKMLNLSYNNLEGEVPTSGVFSNATGVSAVGNGRLCGGLPQLKLDHCVLSGRRNRINMTLLFGVSGFLLLVAVVSLYTVYHRKRTKSATGASDLKKALPNLSYQMLHRATNGFSSENLIGSGASGVVYKGTLEDVETVIAVKIFNLKHRGASKSFVTECKALRNIRHKNLIKVITACSSLDYKGNDFKAIVYEYMANGSLDDWLHPTEQTRVDNSYTASRSRHLNLRQRIKIAVDVAFALEYLHHDCGSSMIHCDLKPSNVLLDKYMMAHVADFGLAKFHSQAIINSSHSQSSSIGVRGTIGYAPPEYGMGNEISTGGDVYSFGILVLEMFTGKRPTDVSFKEGRSLRDYVKSGLAEQDIRIADQALLRDMATEDSDSQLAFEVVISVFEIALSCCTELPRERPDMSDIVGKLSSMRTKLQGIHMQQ